MSDLSPHQQQHESYSEADACKCVCVFSWLARCPCRLVPKSPSLLLVSVCCYLRWQGGFSGTLKPLPPPHQSIVPVCVCVWVHVLKAGPCLNVAAPFLAFGRVEWFSTAVAWQQSLSHVARQPLFHKMHTTHPTSTSTSQSPPLSLSHLSQHHLFGSDNTFFFPPKKFEACPFKCYFFCLFVFLYSKYQERVLLQGHFQITFCNLCLA